MRTQYPNFCFYLNFRVKEADINKVKSLDNFMNYLIGVALLFNVAAYFYFKPKKSGSDLVFRNPTQSEDVDKVVNKYLQLANEAKNVEKVRLDRAAFEATKKIISDREQAKLKAESDMVKSAKIPTRDQVAEMTKKYADNPNMRQPEESQSSGPIGDLDPGSMSAEEKAEYRRQYIENARAGGYVIELSENFEIIKATKIRKPSQQSDEVKSEEY